MGKEGSNDNRSKGALFVASDVATPEVFPHRVPRESSGGNRFHRYFVLQPIYQFNRDVVACEAYFRDGWEDAFEGDRDQATRIMVDNWLLYGLEDLCDSSTIFLNCTRDSLLSGLLPLLPGHAVLEIEHQMGTDDEVVRSCRTLKAQGYRISLDSYQPESGDDRLLEFADYLKINFPDTDEAERASILRVADRTGARTIAKKIETEEEFFDAAREGFGFFQGYYFRQRTSFMKTRDRLNSLNCLKMLDLLQSPGFAIESLVDCIDREPGIESRLLRRANWVTEPECPVNSPADALHLIGKSDFETMVTLAMTTHETFSQFPQGFYHS